MAFFLVPGWTILDRAATQFLIISLHEVGRSDTFRGFLGGRQQSFTVLESLEVLRFPLQRFG